MSNWLTDALDKGASAIGTVASTAAQDVAGFVPGGSALVNGVETFINANPNGIGGAVSQTVTNINNAAKLQQTSFNLLHNPLFWVAVIVVLFALRKKL